MNITKKFGKHIKLLRNEKHLTQEELANLSGLSRQYIGDVERGSRNISLINLEKIAKAFGVSLSQLFNFK
jgi:transcriptional regulator with XRE-family HTH domain